MDLGVCSQEILKWDYAKASIQGCACDRAGNWND